MSAKFGEGMSIDRMNWIFFCLGGLGCLGMLGCGTSEAKNSDDEPLGEGQPATVLVSGEYTYTLLESMEALPLWTTPVTNKVTTGSRPPTRLESGISLSGARNEFESVQLILGPASGEANVSTSGIPTLPNARISLSAASYQEGWIEGLQPIQSGQKVALSSEYGVPIWMTVYIPKDAPPGVHLGEIKVEVGAGVVDVPVKLTVFDFELPDDIHFATQLNISISSLMENRSEEEVKTMLFEHRMTPKSVTWPSGFNWAITWENSSSPTQCTQFYDEPDDGVDYSISALAPKYILGQGWNGIGFPNAMLFQFVDNSTPRPDSFCGQSRGDRYGSEAYNIAWSNWLGQLDTYLVNNAMDSKAYYYVQNEPQNAGDEALAAHLCRLTKAAAPHLRIAISEEPKASIAEDSLGSCGYDIWIAHVRAYDQAYAWQRQAAFGEQVWFYSLDHDPEPYFNPTSLDVQGMNQRIIPWAAWSHRISGWAYYDAGRFFGADGMPGVRAELLREGFEDYEYLWLANGGNHPTVNEEAVIDATVRTVAASMTSWNKDADAFMALRHQLGLYIEGSVNSLPLLTVEAVHPVGNYYINFQNPLGEPLGQPLILGQKEFMKVGWSPYDESLGYGWYGENVGTDILKTGYASANGFNDVQRSYIYDDYGRDNLFEFSLAPATYRITVGVGMAGRAYEGQPHNVSIEGQKIVDDEPTTLNETIIERTVTMEIVDGSLSMTAAGRSASIDDYSYTFVAYLEIELEE